MAGLFRRANRTARSAIGRPPPFHGGEEGSTPSRVIVRALVFRDVGKPGNPPALGAGDRWFKSSHPDFFDNSRLHQCAHDVAEAYRLAMADVRVRLPLGTYFNETGDG